MQIKLTDILATGQTDGHVVTVQGNELVFAAPTGGGGSSGVTSVNTRTGDVTLTKSDVGLANVDNTSDANKPISIATQTALDGKAAIVHTHASEDIAGLSDQFAEKADVFHNHSTEDITGIGDLLDAKASTATFTSVGDGLVPASGGGTDNYLRADGTWATPSGGAGGGGITQDDAILMAMIFGG